ncbi:MAG: hemolysin III family protein [Gemmatimonadaceae bacterium]
MPTTSEFPLKVRLADEIANSITHGFGLLLSLIGLPVLIITTLSRGDVINVIGASVFGGTLVALYLASTLYHSIPAPRAKRVLRILDHVAIFLLIAGTYTPFTLGVLRGAWGWTLFGIVWALAAVGILFKVVLGTRFPRASTIFYLAMGWLIVVAARPLMLNMPSAGLYLLAAGGLAYTCGVVFFVLDHRRYMHAVWHIFVMAGSACHFVAVLRYA